MYKIIISVDLDEKAPKSLRIYDEKGNSIGTKSVVVSDSRNDEIQESLFDRQNQVITYSLELDIDRIVLKTIPARGVLKGKKPDVIIKDDPVKPIVKKSELTPIAGGLTDLLSIKHVPIPTTEYIIQVRESNVREWEFWNSTESKEAGDEYVATANAANSHFSKEYRCIKK